MARLILKLAINLLLLLSTPAFASIGSITDFKGAGNIKRASRTMPATRGSGIEKMDTVSTNSQGKFMISFVDGTTVKITENSRLVIDDFVYDGKNKSKGKLGLKLALGTARYASGALAHGNPRGVNIRTPTATIGVRGTDFLMSVDEAGRTMVVLLPTCFDEKDITKINFDCPTGAIDVVTAAGVVQLNQPLQGTVVESTFTPPSPPATVNLSLRGSDNTLQIASPLTDTGISLVEKARNDLKKYANPSKAASDDNENPDVGASTEQIAVVSVRLATPQEIENVYLEFNPDGLPKETIYTNISPTFKKNVQIGWVYTRLSDDKNQAVTIWVTKDSEAQIVSVQNGIADVYNMMDDKWTTSGTGRPQGNITVIQESGVR
jgi:hypothetical protein